MKVIENQIRQKLEEQFSPLHMELVNESSMHNVPQGSETHFKLLIVSQAFEGLGRVQRQQKIYSLLKEEMGEIIHALSQRVLTPQEWKTLGGNVSISSPQCLGGSAKEK